MPDRLGQQLGNHRLVRLLGKGRLAEVYLGEQVSTKALAAVKVPHTNDHESASIFQREAHILAQLKHPHIIHLVDYGVEGSTPFLALDYASNDTLRQSLLRGTQLSLNVVVSYTQSIASALQYMHAEGMLYLNVKPENVLLEPRSEIML